MQIERAFLVKLFISAPTFFCNCHDLGLSLFVVSCDHSFVCIVMLKIIRKTKNVILCLYSVFCCLYSCHLRCERVVEWQLLFLRFCFRYSYNNMIVLFFLAS